MEYLYCLLPDNGLVCQGKPNKYEDGLIWNIAAQGRGPFLNKKDVTRPKAT